MYLFCKFNRLFSVAWNLRPATRFSPGIRLQTTTNVNSLFSVCKSKQFKVTVGYIPFDIIPK